MQTEFPTVELVRAWVRRYPAQITKRSNVDEIRGELERQPRKHSGAWDTGGMVRTLNKAGVPMPQGCAALAPPTARNWMRAITLLAIRPNDVTDDELRTACETEMNRELQLLSGKQGSGGVNMGEALNVPTVPEAAAPAAAPSDDEIIRAFKLRFPGFPADVSVAAEAAVRKWENANGRAFPVPVAAVAAQEIGHPAGGITTIAEQLLTEVTELRNLVVEVLPEVTELRNLVAELRDELAKRNRPKKRASSDKPSDQVAGAACGT